MDAVLAVGAAVAMFLSILVATMSWQPMAVAVLLSALAEVHLRLDVGIRVGEFMTLFPADGLFPVAAIAGVLRTASMGGISRARALWLLCALVLFLGFVHGVVRYGVVEAAISYRQFFYISAGIFYFSTFDFGPQEQKRAVHLIIGAALMLAVAAMVLWLFPDWQPAGLAIGPSRYAFDDYRVIPAVAAMFLAIAFLIALPSWSLPQHGMLQRSAAPLFLLMVVFLYHRTVWVALFVALAFLLASSRQRIMMHIMALGLGAMLLATIWAVMAGMEINVISASMAAAFDEVARNDSSLAWRMVGWKALTARAFDQGVATVLFGAGFGVDFERQIGWATIHHSPHNVFLEVFLTCGLVGMLAYLLVFVGMALRLRRLGADEGVDGLAMAAAVVAIVVYGFSYGHRYDIVLLIGMLVPVASRAASARLR